jgi:hypothetical protein
MAVIGRTQLSDSGKVLPHKNAYRLLQHPHPVKPFQASFPLPCQHEGQIRIPIHWV